jgi:hypothetical protein
VIEAGRLREGQETVVSLPEVFRVLNDMRSDGVIESYTLGGAMAVLFYAEPTRTYDRGLLERLLHQHGILAPWISDG